MPNPLPYREVVKLEQFLWEKCMARLPHALECATWIYVIGSEDRSLDDKTAEDLAMGDEVLGLEIDFWDEIPRVKFYADEIRQYWEDQEECLRIFDRFARTYVRKISEGYTSTWILKSDQIPDSHGQARPQWVQDWQAALSEGKEPDLSMLPPEPHPEKYSASSQTAAAPAPPPTAEIVHKAGTTTEVMLKRMEPILDDVTAPSDSEELIPHP